MYDPIVFENFLPTPYFDVIQKTVLNPEFSWYMVENITDNRTQRKIENFGFYHNVFDNNVSYSALHSILFGFYGFVQEKILCGNLLKARLDMTVLNKDGLMHEPHIDMSRANNVTVILYLTDSTSPTIIYENQIMSNGEQYSDLVVKQEVKPQENKIVVFDGTYVHTGKSPENESRRVLLNCNFER